MINSVNLIKRKLKQRLLLQLWCGSVHTVYLTVIEPSLGLFKQKLIEDVCNLLILHLVLLNLSDQLPHTWHMICFV